ncbi:hypothetical protein Poli38472_004478 [Pythium oligandrum]|uniref:Uncharacterized protein n=1 Tax=Pythium oligandrum TaxID=41045 RepID=A0A8K1C9W9_PYTOL|nr:hypothetical protein Poli38472_004478 [Pythium oligandrum]|eukprot:TMW59409.1 hypothetical protein Poli38472_004478 [Pythium oligandrum]
MCRPVKIWNDDESLPFVQTTYPVSHKRCRREPPVVSPINKKPKCVRVMWRVSQAQRRQDEEEEEEEDATGRTDDDMLEELENVRRLQDSVNMLQCQVDTAAQQIKELRALLQLSMASV